MTDSEDEVAAEIEADMQSLREAIAAHPFPTRDTILARMLALQPDTERLGELYGDAEHDWAEQLYTGAFDAAVCAAVGLAAGRKGGIDCMRAVFYGVVQFSPLNEVCKEDRALAAHILSSKWDGIYGWMH